MRYTSTIRAITSVLLVFSCQTTQSPPKSDVVADLQLKTGNLISCSPGESAFGKLNFNVTCREELREQFNLGIKLLHSFEYDESEKVFAGIIRQDPECAMAYWGVAMSNYHPLWTPPTKDELVKGSKAISIARSLAKEGTMEKEYIHALSAFYNEWETAAHLSRVRAYEKEMEGIVTRHKNDVEASVFYALALNSAAEPTDKTFARQRKAAAILRELYKQYPDHPGIVHYIIHSYDYPPLADSALEAARRYASVAPSSAHALHMPSHIFTRLGYWQESIESNRASVESAKCYAQTAGIKGHWDEELHGLDYLMYAYLQRDDDANAKAVLDSLRNIREITPANFKVAFAFAAIPSRYVLENRMWKEAANLRPPVANFSWNNFPWQKAMVSFTRTLGKVHTGDLNGAIAELDSLKSIHAPLEQTQGKYQSDQVKIQMLAAEAWIRLKEKKLDEALRLMVSAAELEDKTEKHPVTPGELLPARELLGDMYFEIGKYGEALQAYEASLKKAPNRFNSLHGAAMAARKSGKNVIAEKYVQQLRSITEPNSRRLAMLTLSSAGEGL